MNFELMMKAADEAYAKVLKEMPVANAFIKQNGNLMKNKDHDSCSAIKVVGIGGAGNGSLNHMMEHDIKNVEYVFISSDPKEIARSNSPVRIQIGGTSKNESKNDLAEKLETSRKEHDEIINALRGADIVFLIAGMGGSDGTNATPFVAACAKELGTLTIGSIMKPFTFEGPNRRKKAEAGITMLRQHTDILVTILNDELMLASDDEDALMEEVFSVGDKFLSRWVEEISHRLTERNPQAC